MLGIQHGRERIAVDEIADRQYRILHPEPGARAGVAGVFHLSGEPLDGGPPAPS